MGNSKSLAAQDTLNRGVFWYHLVISFPEWIESPSGFIFLTFSSWFRNAVRTQNYSCSAVNWFGSNAWGTKIAHFWGLKDAWDRHLWQCNFFRNNLHYTTKINWKVFIIFYFQFILAHSFFSYQFLLCIDKVLLTM